MNVVFPNDKTMMSLFSIPYAYRTAQHRTEQSMEFALDTYMEQKKIYEEQYKYTLWYRKKQNKKEKKRKRRKRKYAHRRKPNKNTYKQTKQ